MREFPSAVDRWLAVLLVGLPVACFGFGLWLTSLSVAGGLVCIGSGLAMGLGMLVFLPCRYSLRDHSLDVRAGLIRQTIRYTDIRNVTPTRSLLGGPALSLDRLRIDHRNGSVLVSPKERETFLREIEKRIRAAGVSAAAMSGAKSEEFAAEWLRKHKRFRILSRNWRHKRDELDLVARDKATLVFVEVRARDASALVSGYHSITRKKKEALRRCALAFLRRCHPAPSHFRFDIVEIELNNGEPGTLRHFESVPIFRKNDRTTHS